MVSLEYSTSLSSFHLLFKLRALSKNIVSHFLHIADTDEDRQFIVYFSMCASGAVVCNITHR